MAHEYAATYHASGGQDDDLDFDHESPDVSDPDVDPPHPPPIHDPAKDPDHGAGQDKESVKR